MSRIDLPGYGIERTPSYPPEPACVICRADCIPLNDMDECADCAPRDEETVAEWEARVAPRRAK